MRFFSKPASGRVSGSAFSTSHEPPGRRGASHNSQATHSTIKPRRLATARARVRATKEGSSGEREVVIAGYDAANEFPVSVQARLASPAHRVARHAATLA